MGVLRHRSRSGAKWSGCVCVTRRCLTPDNDKPNWAAIKWLVTFMSIMTSSSTMAALLPRIFFPPACLAAAQFRQLQNGAGYISAAAVPRNVSLIPLSNPPVHQRFPSGPYPWQTAGKFPKDTWFSVPSLLGLPPIHNERPGYNRLQHR